MLLCFLSEGNWADGNRVGIEVIDRKCKEVDIFSGIAESAFLVAICSI
jgi:hypothetical protein